MRLDLIVNRPYFLNEHENRYTLFRIMLYAAPVGTVASMVTPLSPETTVSVPPSANNLSRIPVRPRPNL